MFQLKPGVVIVGNVYTNTIIDAVERAFKRYGIDIVVITEGLGSHATGYHPQGRALDIRVWAIKEADRPKVLATIRSYLPLFYDVVYESDEKDKAGNIIKGAHFHIEADAKKEFKQAA